MSLHSSLRPAVTHLNSSRRNSPRFNLSAPATGGKRPFNTIQEPEEENQKKKNNKQQKSEQTGIYDEGTRVSVYYEAHSKFYNGAIEGTHSVVNKTYIIAYDNGSRETDVPSSEIHRIPTTKPKETKVMKNLLYLLLSILICSPSKRNALLSRLL